MDISDKPVLFHLSPEGRRALSRLVSKKASFPALVLGIDGIGAWILMADKRPAQSGEAVPVMLLKWDYVATVAFEFKPEPPPARATPGFVQG